MDDQENITEHTLETDSYEHAKMIAFDLENGDFGDLICFAIRIDHKPEEELTEADYWDGDDSWTE